MKSSWLRFWFKTNSFASSLDRLEESVVEREQIKLRLLKLEIQVDLLMRQYKAGHKDD